MKYCEIFSVMNVRLNIDHGTEKTVSPSSSSILIKSIAITIVAYKHRLQSHIGPATPFFIATKGVLLTT